MQEPSRGKKKKKKSKGVTALLIIIIIICLIIAGIAGYFCLSKILSDQKSIREFDEIRDEVVVENDEVDDGEHAPISVDFDELWKINKDVVAWLCVPCLDISYPVLKGENNDTYIHTNMYGEYLYAGCLFIDEGNSPDFSDPHTLIYGHNMMNGSMFGTLWHIVYQDAAKDDPYFWVITPEGDFKYKIFSGFESTIAAPVYTLFSRKYLKTAENGVSEFLDWCDEMQEASEVDFGHYEFSIDDQIVTLSTCSGTGETGKRTLVLGVCVNGPVGMNETESPEVVDANKN